MKKDKKANKMVIKIFYLLLLGFMILYISKSSGYYEFAEHKQVELTEEQIKKFEKDVKNNKNVNLTDYIDEREITYNNLASDTGYELSMWLGDALSNGLDGTFSFLSQLFS